MNNAAECVGEEMPTQHVTMPGNSRRQPRRLTLLAALLLLGIFSGCSDSSEQITRVKELESKVAALEAALKKAGPPASAPRLGSIMGMVQLRHGKLWFAGEQANWPLAAYELHELEEDFEDVEKFHPVHGSAGLPLGQMAAQLPKPAMTALKQAIDSGDRARFAASYDLLTTSCNTCHAAASVAFNVIQRPTSSLLSNQDFTPRQPTSAQAALLNGGIEPVSQRVIAK